LVKHSSTSTYTTETFPGEEPETYVLRARPSNAAGEGTRLTLEEGGLFGPRDKKQKSAPVLCMYVYVRAGKNLRFFYKKNS